MKSSEIIFSLSESVFQDTKTLISSGNESQSIRSSESGYANITICFPILESDNFDKAGINPAEFSSGDGISSIIRRSGVDEMCSFSLFSIHTGSRER